MSDQNPLLSFDEDLMVFRQLKTAEERAEFTRLMKRAYAQHISAWAFVQRSPERHVSPQIRPPVRSRPRAGLRTTLSRPVKYTGWLRSLWHTLCS
jgi:hypothetical protein